MFTTVLIANRGEIACRAIRTLKRLGVTSVAVYSDADRNAPHVAEADRAVALGGDKAADSYLRIDKILAAAAATGAQAIYPGYGFLSESAEFADACEAAGIAFIGPTAAQMREFGLKHRARELAALAVGLALAVGFGTFQLSASILPANVPNLVMSGAAESAYGSHFAYLSYLLLHAPVLGVAKGALLTLCICGLFRARPQPVVAEAGQTPLSAAEWRLIALLGMTVLLWMTDSWHGIAPAWIGLAAACVCLLPRIGFLNGEQFAAGVNVRTCIYVAGILGLTALVSHSGLGDRLGGALLAMMPDLHGKPFTAFGSLVGITALLNFVVTANGVPALFTPLAQALSAGSGLPLLTVLMTQVIGYATPLLPYQASPIVVAMGMGKVPAREGLKLCLLLAALSFALLVPLDYLWFRLLGWIP